MVKLIKSKTHYHVKNPGPVKTKWIVLVDLITTIEYSFKSKIFTGVQMIDVKLFRIVTGEEIIAEILSETDDTITVQNGLVVLPSAQGVGFAPWATVISKDEPEITMSEKARCICCSNSRRCC